MLNLMNSIDRLGRGLRLLQLKVKSKQQNFFSNSEMVPVPLFKPSALRDLDHQNPLIPRLLHGISQLWPHILFPQNCIHSSYRVASLHLTISQHEDYNLSLSVRRHRHSCDLPCLNLSLAPRLRPGLSRLQWQFQVWYLRHG